MSTTQLNQALNANVSSTAYQNQLMSQAANLNAQNQLYGNCITTGGIGSLLTATGTSLTKLDNIYA